MSDDNIRYSRMKRVYPLSQWDISFDMNGEVLSRFISFMSDIHPDLPLLFYKDRILIRQRSSDNVSFVTINIDIMDSMNYDPGLGEDAKETDHKIVLIDASGLVDELVDYAKGPDMVTVRIDTKKIKKVEFTCGQYRKHKPLLVIPDFFPKLEVTEKMIKNNRADPSTKGCDMIIEPETFTKICSLGGKKGSPDIVFEATKKGLLVFTSDEESGSSFEILDEPIGQYSGNIEEDENGDEDGEGEAEDITDQFYGEDRDSVDDDYSNDVGNSDIGNTSGDENSGENSIGNKTDNTDTVDSWDMPIPHTDKDNNVSKKGGKKKDKKEKIKDKDKEKEKEKKTDTKSIVSRSKFILFSMTENRSVIVVNERKEYISVINKLKAQSPILIEMRHNAPLIVEQNSPGMWRATLTIAPIVPDENGN